MIMCQTWLEFIPIWVFSANPLWMDQYNYDAFFFLNLLFGKGNRRREIHDSH